MAYVTIPDTDEGDDLEAVLTEEQGREIWLTLIANALRDATYGFLNSDKATKAYNYRYRPTPERAKKRFEAESWFMLPTPWFDTICDYAGVDPHRVCDRAAEQIESVRHLINNYEALPKRIR